MTAVEAGFNYLVGALTGPQGVNFSPAPPAGHGRTDPWWAKGIYRDVIYAGLKQRKKPCYPCVLVALANTRETFTYGMGRNQSRGCADDDLSTGGRQQFTDAWFIIRAVDEAKNAENADRLSHEIDKAIDPGPQTDSGSAPQNGYCVLASFKEESLREVTDPGHGCGEMDIRYLIGGRYKIILSGDGA